MDLAGRVAAATGMITIFTTAKPFCGHSGVIQRNALESWKRLHADVEVILFENEEGAAEAARELGIRHVEKVRRWGTAQNSYRRFLIWRRGWRGTS